MAKIKIPTVERDASPEPDQEEDQSYKRQRYVPGQADFCDVWDKNSHGESHGDDGEDVEVIRVELPPKPSNFRKNQCPVCLETPDILVSTDCGHLYCYDCVFAALSATDRAEMTQGECSVCRTMVRYDKVTYLQLRKRPVEASPCQ